MELEQGASRLDCLAFVDINAVHSRHIGGRHDILVTQDQSVRIEENKIAEQVVRHGEGKHEEKQQIDCSPGAAAHDALLARDVVGTQTFLERLHNYLRTR